MTRAKPQSRQPDDPASLPERFRLAAVATCRGNVEALRRRAAEFRIAISSCRMCAPGEECTGCRTMREAIVELEREAEKRRPTLSGVDS